jgi:hypothetical protein
MAGRSTACTNCDWFRALHAVGQYILPPQPLRWLCLILFDYAGHPARQPGRAWNTSQEPHHRNVRAPILGIVQYNNPRLQLQDQVFLIVCPTRSDGSGKQGPNQEHVQGYYRKPSENCSEEKCKIRASHRGIVPLQRQKELPQNAPAHRRARRLASGHTLGMKTGRHREGKP